MKLYLSGPMTGRPGLNFDLFNAEAERLRSLGHEVINPAEAGAGESWDYYMRIHVRSVADCEAVAVLPDWEDSKGARLEVTIAQHLKMPVLDAASLSPVSSHWLYVFKWLQDERSYQLRKFGTEQDDQHTREGTEWWQQQFDNYLGRVDVYSLDTPNGRQALAKFVATACGWLESAVREYGPLPEPGVSSGNNLASLREVA